VSEVRDRDGVVLESREAGELETGVVDSATAYQIVRLMQDVVHSGTAFKATVLGVPLSGKTGTTDNFKDAWFVGYTPEIITVVWVGLDDSKSMGPGQYGGDVALPIWIEFMAEALKKYPATSHKRPAGIVMEIVDNKTGLLVHKGQHGAWAAFKVGTQPTEYTPEPDAVGTADFLSGEF
jgi:penicillin-binding protein 1A